MSWFGADDAGEGAEVESADAPERAPSVRAAAAFHEERIEDAARARPSVGAAGDDDAAASRRFYERPSVGSVGDAASRFQQQIDEQERGARVLRGERAAADPGLSTPDVKDDIRRERLSAEGGGSVRSAAQMFQRKIDTKESGQQVLRGQRDAPVPAAKRNFTIRKNVDPEVEYEVVWHGCGDPCNKDGPGCSIS